MNHGQRTVEVENLFQRHYSAIRTLAEDTRLNVQDTDNLIEALGDHLHDYEGQLDDDSFLHWANEIMTPAVVRLVTICEWRLKYRKYVLGGIWGVLRKCLDLRDHSQPSAILHQIESDTWCWAIQHYDDLIVPDAAQVSTRLYVQGRFHALTWRKAKLREKARFDDFDLEAVGIIPGDRINKFYFDPGGHDDDPEEGSRRKPLRRSAPSPRNSVLAMKAAPPRLWCPTCKDLQTISPLSSPNGQALQCGHSRPEALN